LIRPPLSFSTFSIHGLCIDSQTLLIGAMKVWNFSVTVCCARAASGAPSVVAAVAAAAPCRRERRFISVLRNGSGC